MSRADKVRRRQHRRQRKAAEEVSRPVKLSKYFMASQRGLEPGSCGLTARPDQRKLLFLARPRSPGSGLSIGSRTNKQLS